MRWQAWIWIFRIGQKNLASVRATPNTTLQLLCRLVAILFFAPSDSTSVLPPLGGGDSTDTSFPTDVFGYIDGVFLSLEGRLETGQTKYVSIGVPFLIFLSVQFATTSPVGVDGWLFLSLSQYFSMFGQTGQATYISHPLVMLPVDYSIRILGGSGRIMAALTGFALSIFWLNVVFSALSKSPSFRRNGYFSR